ncbi:LEM3/CDC50 family protein, putative [Plasmodium ovale]|uniref:LEM3/CDC50 family protein n=2 Tax=Plasmodium ovale TaxID=36330 RepID=A0A1A8VQL8_PLAOA|nr:hypothetical protein, conserved [Plasmodium ovale curtisi]SCP03924.1 LEM3/CDC50 family protein, putative [Plasmodium ovale]
MMECTSEEREFSLISVNRDACEKIFRRIAQKRCCVDVPLHGRVIGGEGGDEEKGQEKAAVAAAATVTATETATETAPVKNKKTVSFEQHFGMDSEKEKGDEEKKVVEVSKSRSDCVKIPIVEKRKSDMLLRKRKSHFFNDSKYNKFMDAFKQQELKKIQRFHYFYKWNVATVILFLLSVVFFLIGFYIYYESSQVIEVNIDYDSEDQYKIFQVTEEMKKPVYVYYKISSFYVNFKNFLSDESQSLMNDCKCKYIKTYEDIYKFRCINDIQTLPEMYNNLNISNTDEKKNYTSSNEKCNVESLSPDEKNQNIFPCGLVSASVFNDKISITLNEEEFSINKFPLINYFDFFAYIKKHKKFLTKYKVWLNTFSPDYKNWFNPPMTSSFIKAYGVIEENLKPGNNYKITFTQNTWPAKHWKAKKSFQLVSLRAIGNSTYELSYSFFFLSLIYIIVIIVMLIFVKFRFCKLGKTFSYCKLVINQNEKMYNRKKTNMRSFSKSKSLAPMEDGDGKNPPYEKTLIETTIPRRPCFCPLH